MKNSKWFAAIGIGMTLATLASVVEAAPPVTRRGTSVMHYMTRNDLIGADSNVVGWLRLQHNEQGHSSKQSLQLFANGLGTNAPYNLIAIIGDDTNAIPVDEVAVDRKG